MENQRFGPNASVVPGVLDSGGDHITWQLLEEGLRVSSDLFILSAAVLQNLGRLLRSLIDLGR